MTDLHVLGERIRKLRTERGWPQEQLATVADVSPRTIQRIENGAPAAIESLKAIASAFNLDLNQLKEPPQPKAGTPAPPLVVPRIVKGSQLLDIVGGADAYQHQHDDLKNENEVGLIGSLLQELADLGDLWNVMEPVQRVDASFRLTQSLSELEEAGFLLFASPVQRKYRIGVDQTPMTLRVAVVLVLRADNPTIVTVAGEKEWVAAKFAQAT